MIGARVLKRKSDKVLLASWEAIPKAIEPFLSWKEPTSFSLYHRAAAQRGAKRPVDSQLPIEFPKTNELQVIRLSAAAHFPYFDRLRYNGEIGKKASLIWRWTQTPKWANRGVQCGSLPCQTLWLPTGKRACPALPAGMRLISAVVIIPILPRVPWQCKLARNSKLTKMTLNYKGLF